MNIFRGLVAFLIVVVVTQSASSQMSPKRILMQRVNDESAGGGGTSSGQPVRRTDQTGPIGVTALDADGDGLSDAEELTLLTDPNKADSDGDALLDGWEVYAYNGVDLKALGADPRQKDIFVEMDYMTRATATNGLGPNALVIQRIVDAFAAAPVSNPNGQTGIRMHAIVGNQVPHDADLSPYRAQFAALKRVHFDTANRGPMFHYMIWADQYDGGTSSGVSLNIPHSDFMVTLGAWNGRTGGTDDQKIGTFIHELGHNLGLKHGGSEHLNFKPNHLSVMNYIWQTRGVSVSGVRRFTYQPFTLDALDESDLDEARGLGNAITLAGWMTAFTLASGATREFPADGALNWNEQAPSTDTHVVADINGDTDLSELRATPDEWLALVFNGGIIGTGDPRAGLTTVAELESRDLPPELTEELNNLLSQGSPNP